MLRTPTRRSDWLSRSARADVHLKLELVQPTSSYKIRGAFNAALRVRESGTNARLVTASAGNHGKAMAHVARELSLPLVVFIASDAPRAKQDAIAAAGAELRRCRDYDDAERQAKRFAAEGGGLYISPYSHPDVIAGAGTVGLEIVEDLPSVDTVVVPIGGGGLISGIGIAVKALSPRVRVVGVEVSASAPFTASLAAGRLVEITVGPSIADGLTGNLDPETITLDFVRSVVDEIVVVQEEEVEAGLRGMFGSEHLLCEGAAAVGVAALASGRVAVEGQQAAVVVTGANIDAETLVRALKKGTTDFF